VVLITSGVNERTGGATVRLRLLDKNAAIYRDIVPQIVRAVPKAVLVAVTDPPDPLAEVAREAAGHDRVLSTGTFLDSLRFRAHLGKHFGVDPANPQAALKTVSLCSTLATESGSRDLAGRLTDHIEHHVRL
jgi:L-lactate dehydrogenase